MKRGVWKSSSGTDPKSNWFFYWVRILDANGPDLVQIFEKIGPDLVWILNLLVWNLNWRHCNWTSGDFVYGETSIYWMSNMSHMWQIQVVTSTAIIGAPLWCMPIYDADPSNISGRYTCIWILPRQVTLFRSTAYKQLYFYVLWLIIPFSNFPGGQYCSLYPAVLQLIPGCTAAYTWRYCSLYSHLWF